MSIKPYQAFTMPVGHFDIKDTDAATLKGGEVLVFDRAPSGNTDKASIDILRADGYSVYLRLATAADVGPFFFAASGDAARTSPGYDITNIYSSTSAYAQSRDGSGKANFYAESGFFAISTDVTDTTTITSATAVNTRLYPNDDGKLTTVQNDSNECVGTFVEYQRGAALRSRPGIYHPGTHSVGDTIIVYKGIRSNEFEGEASYWSTFDSGWGYNVARLYVATGGDDANDGRTALSPKLTLQSAYDEIPYSTVAIVFIHVAAGIYADVAIFGEKGVGASILVVGAHDSDVPVTLSGGATLTGPTKVAQYTHSTGGFSPFSDGEKILWQDIGFGSDYALYAMPIGSKSSSPNLVAAGYGAKNGAYFLSDLTTQFSGTVSITVGSAITFSGIRFAATGILSFDVDSPLSSSGLTLNGCTINSSATITSTCSNLTIDQCYISSDMLFYEKHGPLLRESHVSANATLDDRTRGGTTGLGTLFNSALCIGGRYDHSNERSEANVNTCDFEGIADYAIRVRSSSFLKQKDDNSVENCVGYLKLEEGSKFFNRNTGTVRGATSNVPVSVLSGSYAFGLSQFDGDLTNSTTSEDDVIVGSNATPFSFSDLPKTDFSLGDTSQGVVVRA